MKVCLYNSETFQFEGAVEVCKNPEEPNKWLFPAFSTTIFPKKDSDYEHLFWDKDKQQWYEKNIENQEEKQQPFNIHLLYDRLSSAYKLAKKYPLYIGNFNNKDRFISVKLRDKLALLANTFITFADTIDLEDLDNEKITLSKNEFMSILSIVHKKYEELYWKYKDMKRELFQINDLSDELYDEYIQKINDLFKDN